MSERMACRLAGLSRAAYRRPLNADTVTDPDRALREWLRAWAKDHPRYGYRRAYHDARAEGWVVNHKKIQPELDLCSGFRGFGHVSRLVSRIWASGSGH